MAKNMIIKHYIYAIILFSVYFTILSTSAQTNFKKSTKLASVNQEPPIISLGYVGDGWKTIVENPENVNNNNDDDNGKIFYSNLGDDLDIICTASYPMNWNISGIINPPEIVKIYPTERDLMNGTHLIKMGLFFVDAEKFLGLHASADVFCQKGDDPTVNRKVSVFVKGSPGNIPVLGAKTNSVKNSKVIPCFTTDPSTPTQLFQSRLNGDEILVQNVIYKPAEGFYSENVFRGQYVCRKGTNFVRITASTSSQQIRSEYHFAPESSPVMKFTDEAIILKCSAKGTGVKLVVVGNENVTIEYLSRTPSLQEVRIAVAPNVSNSGSADIIRGAAACLPTPRKDQEVLFAWEYQFYSTPEIYLDNFEGEVDCISEFTPKVMQTVRCKNHPDCQFMKRCLSNRTDCNFKRQKQFFADTDTFCFIESLGRGRACASVPYSHLNGIAQCTVAGGLTKTWEYFVSLDFLKYSNWKDAPTWELVRMDEMPRILYTNKSTEFNCLAVAYLFANSISFELETSNGTRYLLESNNDTIEISRPLSENRRKIDEFNVIGVLTINLPLDAVAIHCQAPFGDSDDVVVTSRKFETRHLLFPTIESGKERSSPTFYIGEKEKRLTCLAMGEPQPDYTWYFSKNSISKSSSNFTKIDKVFGGKLQTSVGSNGESYLEFSEVVEKHNGEYKCIAKNSEGEAMKLFKLNVEDEPVSKKSVVYVTTVLIILTLLILVLVAMFIFMRRYKAAKELVRSLTDNEIEEFFKGKPELLNNAQSGGQAPVEVIDFLPYKNEYEIALDDIEFDQNSNNFLGSGEFSYVVRGRIISKGKPVAVKVSKPSADVTLFKSLLSEVKIMIYIGNHENVVTLVGVCTQSIRNRSIHIATEVCELGSIDTYLRKVRPNFVNLIDANQRIERNLLTEEDLDKVSTLDLINFAAQIAHGMEYLTLKSVIHADLAARNVLLTFNKVCKISDFGLSKKLYESNNYVKKSKSPLPWRWMPPESLNTLTFSSHSDVWSYGATLYEIFTLGDIPYPNEEWNKEFLSRLASGMRMGRPKYSTPEIYSKIMTCWENEPELRPQFLTLRIYFEGMLEELGVPLQTKTSTSSELPQGVPPPFRIDSVVSKTESLYANCDVNDCSPSETSRSSSIIPPPRKQSKTNGCPIYQNQAQESQPNYVNYMLVEEREEEEVDTAPEEVKEEKKEINPNYVNTME